MRKALLVITPVILISISSTFGQGAVTDELIKNIRSKYLKIVNRKINGLDTAFIDVSYKPTKQEMEEAPSGHLDTYLIYFVGSDTLLIRNINLRDEGGAFSTRLTEVSFWGNKPIFYYDKWYTSSDMILNEERIYIADEKVVRKLEKTAAVSWVKVLDVGISNVFVNEVPNNEVGIKPDDYGSVRYFIETSKQKIEGRQ